MRKAKLEADYLDVKEVVRVATNNNFNCTPKEYKQLEKFVKENPHKFFFVNCNVNTPKLITLNEYPYQAVITANPNLAVDDEEIEALYDVDPAKVAFVRVKWLPENPGIKSLVRELLHEKYTVMLTIQRWNSRRTLLEYTDEEHYHFSHNRFRLAGESLRVVECYADDLKRAGHEIHICDRQNLGCGGCGLCSKLTLGRDLKLSSLNLSSSGLCPHSCPDCYAKAMQHFVKSCGHQPIKFDTIKQNAKQAGRTKHIKDAKEAMKK